MVISPDDLAKPEEEVNRIIDMITESLKKKNWSGFGHMEIDRPAVHKQALASALAKFVEAGWEIEPGTRHTGGNPHDECTVATLKFSRRRDSND